MIAPPAIAAKTHHGTPITTNPIDTSRKQAISGKALDVAARLVCDGRTSVQWVSSSDLGPAEPSFFAADGFHASPAGYERWAQAICDHLDL